MFDGIEFQIDLFSFVELLKESLDLLDHDRLQVPKLALKHALAIEGQYFAKQLLGKDSDSAVLVRETSDQRHGQRLLFYLT